MVARWDALIVADLKAVEEEIHRSVKSRQPLLTEIAMHVIDSGGKRIRPGVALLSFYAAGGRDPKNMVKIAAAFELIHSATLVHDDINDGADLRRGREAAYRKYGTQRALVTGDFLFVQGFRLGSVMKSQDIVEIVADACVSMAEGEILQIAVERNSSTSLATYLEIIGGKTAHPIEASARVGGYVAGGSLDQIEALGRYGLNIGYAFQVVDDILDVTGSKESLGKPLGMDILDSRVSLPLMIAMQDDFPDSARLREIFAKQRKTRSEVEEALALVRSTDAVRTSWSHAEMFRDNALAALKDITSSAYKESLAALAATVLNRRS